MRCEYYTDQEGAGISDAVTNQNQAKYSTNQHLDNQ